MINMRTLPVFLSHKKKVFLLDKLECEIYLLFLAYIFPFLYGLHVPHGKDKTEFSTYYFLKTNHQQNSP